MKQIADAVSFVARFAAGACTRSIPHIYISAVPFCAKSSSVYDNYWRYMRGLMEVEGRAMKEWQSAGIVVRETDAEVYSVAFSPDGTRIVSGSYDHTIRVWDARSGDVVAGPFEGHTDYITSVAFSPDGTCIVSGSDDRTIRGLTHAKHNNSIFPHTPHPLSHLKHFVFKQDGWITVDNYPFFWISPLFRPYLPFPSNTFVIGPQGNIFITYPPHLNVGAMWPSSFAPHT